MRIAIESNDGVHLSSPFHFKKNFIIYEVVEESLPISISSKNIPIGRADQIKPIQKLINANNMVTELSNCSALISRGLNEKLLNNFKKVGVDFYITFQDKVKEALQIYLKNKMLRSFLKCN